MDRMLYVAMAGAKHNMRAQAINTNNLANVSTNGFMEDLAAMKSVQSNEPGFKSRVYAVTADNGFNAERGAEIATGKALDITVEGDGWIAVHGDDGKEGYVRTSSLNVNRDGFLVDDVGRQVIGSSNGPINVPPYEYIEIGSDGTISIQGMGQQENSIVAVDRIKLVSSENSSLKKGIDGLMYHKSESFLPINGSVKINSGVIEGSNVNPVQSMITMIALSRQFEQDVKMMKVSEDVDSSSAQLLRIS